MQHARPALHEVGCALDAQKVQDFVDDRHGAPVRELANGVLLVLGPELARDTRLALENGCN